MQREIKFRIWDKNDERMKYADIEYFDDMIGFRFGHRGFEEDDNNDIVIMQYSGLRDKNGKEIYEGDIVESPFTGDPVSVVWSEPFAQFTFGGAEFNVEAKPSDIEIIGNVYENPELCN